MQITVESDWLEKRVRRLAKHTTLRCVRCGCEGPWKKWGENYSRSSRTHNRIRSSRLKASSFLENVDKGSRQISIVTLGKGMALVVRCGTLESERGRAGTGMLTVTRKGDGRRPALLVCPRSSIGLRLCAVFGLFQHLSRCFGAGPKCCLFFPHD